MSLSQTGKLLAGSYYYEVCSKVCSMIGTPYNLSVLDGMLKIEVYERFVLNK